MHVAGEASRVAEFRRICDENPADIQVKILILYSVITMMVGRLCANSSFKITYQSYMIPEFHSGLILVSNI